MDLRVSKSFLSRWQRSHWLRIVHGLMCLLLINSLAIGTAPIPSDKPSSYPEWWFQREVIPRLHPANSNPPLWANGDYPAPDDFAVANLGQLKQMATQAAAEISAHMPGGTSPEIDALVAQWGTPPASGTVRNDFAALNLGQLKAVAKPFYDRLMTVQYTNAYPWGNGAADDFAIANLGQVKKLFSFDLTRDTDGNGLPDWYQPYVGTNGLYSILNPSTNPAIVWPAIGTHGEGGGGPPTLDPRSTPPPPTNPGDPPSPPTLWLTYHSEDVGDPPQPEIDYSKIDVNVDADGGYSIERKIDSDVIWQQINLPAGADGVRTDQNLLLGHTYYYRARGVNDSGQSAPSPAVSYSPDLNLGAIQQVANNGGPIPGFRQFGNAFKPQWYRKLVYTENGGSSFGSGNETETDLFDVGSYHLTIDKYFESDQFGANGTSTQTETDHDVVIGVWPGSETLDITTTGSAPGEGTTHHYELSWGDLGFNGTTDGVPKSPPDKGIVLPFSNPTLGLDPAETTPTYTEYSYADPEDPESWYNQTITLSIPLSDDDLLNLAFDNSPDYGAAMTIAGSLPSVSIAGREVSWGDDAGGGYNIWQSKTTLTHTLADGVPAHFVVEYVPYYNTGGELDHIVEQKDLILIGTQTAQFEYVPERGLGYGIYVIEPSWRLTAQDSDSYAFNYNTFQSSEDSNQLYSYHEALRNATITQDQQVKITLTQILPGVSYNIYYDSNAVTVIASDGKPLDSGDLLGGGEYTFYVVFKNAKNGDIASITVTASQGNSSFGEDIVKVKYVADFNVVPGGGDPNNNVPAVPFDDASGPLYRKIALNGRPMADGKPQRQPESDVQSEETFVDAMTLGLRHTTSDIFIPLSGSDLSLTVSRSVQSEVWSVTSGLRPHEQVRPFGICWTSNLGAHVEIVRDLSAAKPDVAYVTDESGAVHTFVGTGATFVPMPSARHDQSACLTSFDGTTYTGKFGTKITFAPLTTLQAPSAKQGSLEEHVFLRPMRVQDRLGTALVFKYTAESLLPSSMQAQNAQGQDGAAIYFQYDLGNHITDIWDPLGHHYHYTYHTAAYANAGGGPPESYLSSVTGPDGTTTQYSYEIAIESGPFPGDDPTYLPDTMFHCEITSITDPLGNATQIAYKFDHSRWQSDSKGNYHIQTGAPRNVHSVTLPGPAGVNGGAAFVNNSNVRLVGSVVGGQPMLAVVGNRATAVTDAEGHQTGYSFGGAQAFAVNNLNNLTVPGGGGLLFPQPVSVPCIVYYPRMGVTTEAGLETFTFEPTAALALSGTTDLSGNTTTYQHADALPHANFSMYLSVFQNMGFTGFYDDPTQQTNALGNSKTFIYGPYRQLAEVDDEAGHKTTYDFDAQARRIRESAGDGARVTEFEYGDNRFPGTVTKSTVKTAAGDPGWATPLVTIDQLDAAGRVSTETTGPVSVSSVYDGNGNKLAVTDGNGNQTVFQYDARNRLSQVTYPASQGQALPFKTFLYDGRGNKVQETDENGHATIFSYDALSRLTEARRVMSSGDLVTAYSYNKVNSRVTVTDARLTTTRTTFDAIQRPIQVTEAQGTAVERTTAFVYGANSGGSVFNTTGFKPTQSTDPRGYVANVVYDALYRPTSKSIGYGSGQTATTQMGYDDVGNLVQTTDSLGKITKTSYDALHRPVSVTAGFGSPDAGTATMAYSGTGLKWKATDELNRQTETHYDNAGRPVLTLGPVLAGGSRSQTTLGYDAASNVVSKAVLETAGLQEVWTYGYDGRNRKVQEVQPPDADGNLAWTLLTLDPVGNVTAARDALGNVTNNAYDAANRLTSSQAPSITLADGSNTRPTTLKTYDANGNVLTSTDPNGHVTTNTYDALNRLATTTDGAQITVQNTYDLSGNLIAVHDGKGQSTSFEYDGLNRNTKILDATGAATVFAYDGLNKTSRTDARGWITQYGYDGRNRLISAISLSNPADNRGYAYDAVGNLLAVAEPNKGGKADVAYTYDALNRVGTETSGGVTHAYSYDLAGNRVVTLYGGTGRLMESTYDARNRLLSINERLNGQAAQAGRVTTYGYDAAGNVVVKILPNGDRVDMSYDSLNRMRTIQGRAPPTNPSQAGRLLYCYAQSFDSGGNKVRIDETYPDSSGNRALEMACDGANRLLTEKITDSQNSVTTTTYSYDAANNRASKSVNGLVATYTYNNLNQLTGWTDTAGHSAAYGYDLNGNRLTRTVNGATDAYSYDTENRLISLAKNTIDQPSTSPGTYGYIYDYRTRRVARTEAGNTTQVVFSGGTSVQELAGNAATVEYVRGSDYGGGIGGILYTVRGNALSFTHYDGRGDVTAKTDGGGNLTYQASYEAFGSRTREVGATQDRQKANTKEEDPTGLLNEGMRYRDLETGTFTTRDPAGFVDGPNLYAYVRQNPWSNFDPEGLSAIGDFANGAMSWFKGQITSAIDSTPVGPFQQGYFQRCNHCVNTNVKLTVSAALGPLAGLIPGQREFQDKFADDFLGGKGNPFWYRAAQTTLNVGSMILLSKLVPVEEAAAENPAPMTSGISAAEPPPLPTMAPEPPPLPEGNSALTTTVESNAAADAAETAPVYTQMEFPFARGASIQTPGVTTAGETFVRVGASPQNLKFGLTDLSGVKPGTYAFPEETFNAIGQDPDALKNFGDLPGPAPQYFRILRPPPDTPIQRGIVPGGEFGGVGGAEEVIFPKGF